MKKSFSVIFAIYCMGPVLLACDYKIKCSDVQTVEKTIQSIDTYTKNAHFEALPQAPRGPKEMPVDPRLISARVNAKWVEACANFPRLSGELDEHRKSLNELFKAIHNDKGNAKAYGSALLVGRNITKLQQEMTSMCELVSEGADPTDISNLKGTFLKDAALRTIALIKNDIIALGKPLYDKACNNGKVSFLRPTGAQDDPRVCEGQKGSLREPFAEPLLENEAPTAAPAASAGSARG